MSSTAGPVRSIKSVSTDSNPKRSIPEQLFFSPSCLLPGLRSPPMAGDASNDEAAIERQLEQQLAEHKETLEAVDEALASDPSNLELLSVHEELISAIKDAEEGLLHLKHSRLLREADRIFGAQEAESLVQNAKVEPLVPSQLEPEPLEPEIFSVGSRCRFRHIDGRWYNGQILEIEGGTDARISFLTPTTESMLMCKFFLQQRCRFGSNCRLSHGLLLPLSSLKQYIPTVWQHHFVGSTIWAASGGHSGTWRRAELELWDDELRLGQIVFRDDGSSMNLRSDDLAMSEFAEMTEDDENNGSSSEESEYSSEEDNDAIGNQGIGFTEATPSKQGVQTETVLFAKWEQHTRGIASKMMAGMGYREGTGLGISGQGMLDPIPVKVLPPKQSLDHALATNKTEDTKARHDRKRRSRGGKRKREKKFAAAVRAAKAEEEQETPDVFSFINSQLAGQDKGDGSSGKTRKGSGGGSEASKKREDRRCLVAYDDEVKELRIRVEKLEEMVNRNRKDKAMYEAASRKLNETRKALADAEAAHASVSSAVANKEKEKKWLKF